MTSRHALEKILFIGQVGVRQSDKDRQQDRRRSQQRRIAEKPAADGGNHPAREEEADHQPVGFDLLRRSRVPVAHIFGKMGTHLPDMVGHKGGRGRRSLQLTEGIELHRADEIQRDLADLVGDIRRKQRQNDDRQNFQPDEHGVPPQEVKPLDRLAEVFGKERPRKVGGDRYEQVERAFHVPLADRHRKQHDIGGLRVAEHAAPQQKGIRPEPSRRRDQAPIHPSLFTF